GSAAWIDGSDSKPIEWSRRIEPARWGRCGQSTNQTIVAVSQSLNGRAPVGRSPRPANARQTIARSDRGFAKDRYTVELTDRSGRWDGGSGPSVWTRVVDH